MRFDPRVALAGGIHRGLALKVVGVNVGIVTLAILATLRLIGASVPGSGGGASWQWIALGGVVLGLILATNWLLLARGLRPLVELERAVRGVVEGQRPPPRPSELPGGGTLERTVGFATLMLDQWGRDLAGLEGLVARCRSAYAAEHVRLSGELYDEIAQKLATVLLRLTVLHRSLREEGEEELARELQAVRDEVRAAVEGVRRTARMLQRSASASGGPMNRLEARLRAATESPRKMAGPR